MIWWDKTNLIYLLYSVKGCRQFTFHSLIMSNRISFRFFLSNHWYSQGTPPKVLRLLANVVSRCWPHTEIMTSNYYIQGLFCVCIGSANERRLYSVTSSLIGWAQTHNDPAFEHIPTCLKWTTKFNAYINNDILCLCIGVCVCWSKDMIKTLWFLIEAIQLNNKTQVQSAFGWHYNRVQ